MFRKIIPLKAVYSALAILGLLLVASIVFSPYIPYSISLNVNDIAKQTIISPRFIEFQTLEDKLKTEELRMKRAVLVEQIYSIDEQINKYIKTNIINSFTLLKKYRHKKAIDPAHKIPKELIFLNAKSHTYLNSIDNATLASIEYVSLDVANKILANGIKKIDYKEEKKLVLNNLKVLDVDIKVKDLIFRIIINYLKPNLILNKAKTNDAIATAKNSIKPITTIFKEGQPLIYKNEIVTRKHIDIFKALNIYGLKANIYKFIGIFLNTFLLFLFLERFLYFFEYEIYKEKKYFILLFSIIFIVVALARALQLVSVLPPVFELKYLIPIPMLAMLITVMIGPNIALVCGIIVSIFIAIMYKTDLTLLIFLFLGCAAATFSTYREFNRKSIILAGNIVGLFNVVAVICLGLFMEINEPLWFGANISLAFASGVISAMIVLAALPYFESLFKVTTNQSLLEFSNLNHPLLKRLMLSAPGTYQHSLMVANLAEAAAEAIDANPILARAGAYFHDIGKIKRPLFFTENQFSGENPHNSLTPRMSKRIIANHIKDGIELANKHKIPSIIKSFINEHHGTSLVSYFYTQVLHTEEITNEASTKEEFRYHCPTPRTKETGIVMLADSLEAAIKALQKPSINKIENITNKIFKERIDSEQFNECPLTFKDFDQIKETFLRIFQGMYHSRLDYQEELENITKQSNSKNS